MKFSIALPLLALGAMAAPTVVERGRSEQSAVDMASNLPAIKASTESGQEITLIELEDGVYDPATGEWVDRDQVVEAAGEGSDGEGNEKRTFLLLGALARAFSGRHFGGYKVHHVTHVHNNYHYWGHGPWTVRKHNWCNSCVSYQGHRGGYAVFDTHSHRRVYGPQHRGWGRW